MEKIKELPFYFYKDFEKDCYCKCSKIKKRIKFNLVVEFEERNGGIYKPQTTIKVFKLYYRAEDEFFIENQYDRVVGDQYHPKEDLNELIDKLKQELKDKKII